MGSIRCTSGNSLNSGSGNVPTISGNFSLYCWLKIPTAGYGTADLAALSLDDGTNHFMTIQIGGTTSQLVGTLYANGSSSQQAILTGSDTTWTFVSWRHASGSNVYTLSYRKQGVTTLTSLTFDVGLNINAANTLYIGTDGAAENTADCSIRSLVFTASNLSDAALLLASQSLVVGSADQTDLVLDTVATAGSNPGSGSDWTVTGTLVLDTTEPMPGISGFPAAGAYQRNMNINANYRQ